LCAPAWKRQPLPVQSSANLARPTENEGRSASHRDVLGVEKRSQSIRVNGCSASSES
jgi:hypothetical protein